MTPLDAPDPSPGGVVRVPVSTPRLSPTALGRSVWAFASGGTGTDFKDRFRRALRDRRPQALVDIDAMTFSPLASRESGASYVFDAHGVRLEGYRKLRLALTWSEIGRVALQLQHSKLLGLRSLRLVVWPVDHQAFAAAHPECGILWDEEVGGYSLNLSTGTVISQTKMDLAVVGVAHAGGRFSGQVEDVRLSD